MEDMDDLVHTRSSQRRHSLGEGGLEVSGPGCGWTGGDIDLGQFATTRGRRRRMQ